MTVCVRTCTQPDTCRIVPELCGILGISVTRSNIPRDNKENIRSLKTISENCANTFYDWKYTQPSMSVSLAADGKGMSEQWTPSLILIYLIKIKTFEILKICHQKLKFVAVTNMYLNFVVKIIIFFKRFMYAKM